jgi:ribosomal protein S18 acetylase RimI-like enzyme
MTILKAVLIGGLVGSVRGSAKNDTCTVSRLMVDPKSQGRGIGRQLMQSLERLFPGVDRFELNTGSRSERNIRFYEHLGYRVFNSQVLSPKVTLVYMEKVHVGA